MKQTVIFGILMFIIIGLGFFACKGPPMIMRELTPVTNEILTDYSNVVHGCNVLSYIKDDIRITIEYLDKRALIHRAAATGNPYSAGLRGPLLTVFRLQVHNNKNEHISMQLSNIVLLESNGKKLPVLTYEKFKQFYPNTMEYSVEYSFIEDREVSVQKYSDDYYKRKEAKQTLFKGGVIYPHTTVDGILAFPRVSENALELEVLISDIFVLQKMFTEQEFYEEGIGADNTALTRDASPVESESTVEQTNTTADAEHNTAVRKKGYRTVDTIEFVFPFKQKVLRK